MQINNNPTATFTTLQRNDLLGHIMFLANENTFGETSLRLASKQQNCFYIIRNRFYLKFKLIGFDVIRSVRKSYACSERLSNVF